MYDYLIVGAGLFGSTFAYEARKRNKKCLVIDRRNHLGGNLHCHVVDGIQVHTYGAHIFHTDQRKIWDYVNQFAEFNRYTNAPIANYLGEIYNLPFNMNTFNKLWGVITPEEAKSKIEEQIHASGITVPSNLEEQAISLVGIDIYEKLIKGYTEKQWGRKSSELPAFIIKRLPIRFTYDNNYFNDRYQGIPIGGYNIIIEKMLEGVETKLNTDFFLHRGKYNSIAKKIIFTGMIDEFFDYRFGPLEYRSLRFEHEHLPLENYQGNAVVNYTDSNTPYTRIIEHKHFEFGTQKTTVVTKEYPCTWKKGDEPYYPVNDEANTSLYMKYQEVAKSYPEVIFAGRLGDYKYYDMHHVLEHALALAEKELS